MLKILATAAFCWVMCLTVSFATFHMAYGGPQAVKSLIGSTVVVALALITAFIQDDVPLLPRRRPWAVVGGLWAVATVVTWAITGQRHGLTWQTALAAALLSAVAVFVSLTMDARVRQVRRQARR